MANINSTNNDSSVLYEQTGNKAKAVMDIYAKSNEGLNIQLTHYSNNQATNFTGYKGYLTVRDIKDGNVVALRCVPQEEHNPDYGTVKMTSGGNINIMATSAQLSEVYTSSVWKYDLLIVSPAGIKSRLVEGNFYINRSATYGS